MFCLLSGHLLELRYLEQTNDNKYKKIMNTVKPV